MRKPHRKYQHGMACCVVLLAGCGSAAAYESENAVPLTLAMEAGRAAIGRIAIRLSGRDVEIATTVSNPAASSMTVGFYAYTPQFSLLGEGEEHADKSFSSLSASIDSAPRAAAVTRRGYFMGRDITAELSRAGLPALPDANADEKKLAKLPLRQGLRPELWQGYAGYAWSVPLAARATANFALRYRALPQFGVEELGSGQFARRVQQHCGSADAVRRLARAADAKAERVLFERYELPVQYMASRELMLEVAQPARNWLGAQPVAVLVCGLADAADGPGAAAGVAGALTADGTALSVLVVSTLARLEGDADAN